MVFYAFIFIVGLIVGSFLNVVILRLRSGEKIVNDRSHCPHCKHVLSPRDLFPVISFVISGGRCRYCHEKISWQYPLVELAVGIFFVVVTWTMIGGLDPLFLFWNHIIFFTWIRNLFFVCVLVVVFVYDLRWYLILDKVTIPAMVAAFIFNIIIGVDWKNICVAALIGLGFFLLQYMISRGAWIGGGDLRMGFLMGLMVGWPQILVALFASYIVGASCALILLAIKRKKMQSQIPFGTFLAIGTFVALLWGENILVWYRNLL